MAKAPREGVPEQDTGKLDQDLDRIVEKEKERARPKERPDDPGAPLAPA